MGLRERSPATRAFDDQPQRDFDDCAELSRAEMRTGKVTWDYMAGTPVDRLPYRAEEIHGFSPEFTVEPYLPPEFWRGILIAAAASSVMWVGGFYLLAWWFSS